MEHLAMYQIEVGKGKLTDRPSDADVSSIRPSSEQSDEGQ